jgi:hypothetical protein
MEWGKQMEKHQENAKLSLYQNTNYSFERRERKTLILDVIIMDGASTTEPPTFNLKLSEPLIIDKLSDIYLDSFISNKQIVNTDTTTRYMAFILNIDQFNIQSVVATNLYGSDLNNKSFNMSRSIIIPNEASATTTTIHKGKKMNYICTINPTKLSNISGSISDNGVTTKFQSHDVDVTYGNPFGTGDHETDPARFIAEFIIVARDKE